MCPVATLGIQTPASCNILTILGLISIWYHLRLWPNKPIKIFFFLIFSHFLYSIEEPPNCDRFNDECSRLQCGELGVQRVRTVEGCERCSCVQVQIDCEPLRHECNKLKCTYGMDRKIGFDGCERYTFTYIQELSYFTTFNYSFRHLETSAIIMRNVVQETESVFHTDKY